MRDLRACWQFAILGFALLGPTLPANCQTFGTPGLNAAVFNSGLTPSPSYDLVDATQFSGDICARISSIFSSYNTSALIDGVVIDARGVPTANLNCNSGDGNPWASLTADFSSVVLLPAGTITIAATWILPSQTWLLGEGPDSTIITAQGMSGDMIDMGAETTAGTSFNCAATGVQDCPGILIEHLGLNGGTSSSSVNGIVNCCAQELSHVNDVSITNVQIGLKIYDKFSQNSGSYTHLTISNVATCLVIGSGPNGNVANTRGVHGLNCSNATNPTAAVTIDSPNNTLEDIAISGSSRQDGILVGSNSTAQGNVFLNISGSGLANVIELSNNSTALASSNNCPNSGGSSSNFVCDITILAVTSTTGGTTILDDLTGTAVADSSVAMYILGEPVQNAASGSPNNIGYSRFTTATLTGNAPTWLVGTHGPTAMSGCVVGSLYSCTSSSCPSPHGTTEALWECGKSGTGTGWAAIQ